MLRYLLIILIFPLYYIVKNKKKSEDVIGIFFFGKMGDTVCITPLLRTLRKNKPESKIVLISNEYNEEVLSYSDLIDDFVGYNTKDNLISILKSKNINVSIVLSPSADALYLSLRIRVNRIICSKIVGGYSPYMTISYRILSLFAERVNHDLYKYAPREYLRLLEPFDIFSKDTKKYLSYSDKSKDFVSKLFDEFTIPVVGIVVSAGNKVKQWPIKNFAELIVRIKEESSAEVVLIGGKNDSQYYSELIDNLPNNIVVKNFIGELTIDQLKAFISRLNLLVGVDTGPIYIGEAFDVPTVDIVGPVSENVQPPVGKIHKIVLPPYERVPQLFVMNSRSFDEKEAIKQAESITVDQVLEQIRSLDVI